MSGRREPPMTRLKVSAAGCLGWVAAAVAGPINMNWVAPDAAWIVHIDVDAVRGSTIGKFIIANWDKEDEAELAAVKAKIGIDPVHDLKGVTVFGKSRNTVTPLRSCTGSIPIF